MIRPIILAIGCEPRRLLLSGLVALLVTLPCWWSLNELAYAVHPAYHHRFGDMVRMFLISPNDRLRFLEIVAFVVGFTLLQECCLKRWPLTRQRLIPAAVVVLGLTATVVGLVLAMEGSLLLRPGYVLKSIRSVFVWLVPWITYGYLARSFMTRLRGPWARFGVYFGSLLLLGLITMVCSSHWGVMDGEVQALFAGLAALPMSSIMSGGFSDLALHREVMFVEEGACQHA